MPPTCSRRKSVSLEENKAAVTFRNPTSALYPPCTAVAVNVPHLALDDPAEVARSVDQVPVARVDADVVTRLKLAVSVLVKEDQVAGAEVGFISDPAATPPLVWGVVDEPPAELPEDHLGVAGAVLLTVGLTWMRRRP